MLILTLVSLGVAMAAPSGANALTVSVGATSEVQPFCDREGCVVELRAALAITDAAGADNDVTIDASVTPPATTASYAVITDASGPVTAGAGCETVQGGGARCALPQPTGKFKGTPYQVTAGSVFDLGAGNDTLHLVGSGIFCGEVRGGTGNDALVGNGVAQSCGLTWDGGEGADRVTVRGAIATYAARLAPVTVTLGDGANDGVVGEGDNVGADVAEVVGGSGNDHLTGIDTAKGDLTLAGGDGDDVLTTAWHLSGGAGNDDLTAGNDRSWMEGGSGNDHLTGGPGNDSIDGGSGKDVLSGAGGSDGFSWSGTVTADGGPGNDGFFPNRGDHQVIVGGQGRDALYGPGGKKSPAVRISLDGRANDGRRRQHNNYSGLERVVIVNGVLIGSSGNDDLQVTNGSVFGRGGDDVVQGSRTVDGGSGRDTMIATAHGAVIRAADGQKDTLKCGVDRGPRFWVKVIKRDRQDTLKRCFVRNGR